jgi:hypothetical protein
MRPRFLKNDGTNGFVGDYIDDYHSLTNKYGSLMSLRVRIGTKERS